VTISVPIYSLRDKEAKLSVLAGMSFRVGCDASSVVYSSNYYWCIGGYPASRIVGQGSRGQRGDTGGRERDTGLCSLGVMTKRQVQRQCWVRSGEKTVAAGPAIHQRQHRRAGGSGVRRGSLRRFPVLFVDGLPWLLSSNAPHAISFFIYVRGVLGPESFYLIVVLGDKETKWS
jgi:hypothetical protein